MFGTVSAYADCHEMIRDGELDAIDVVSDEESHGECVLACLAAGKHVFVEKPLATGHSEQGGEAMTATRSKGILIGGVVAMTVLALSHHASAAQKSSGARTGTQPKEARKKFSIPVWHPDARWKMGKKPHIGGHQSGELDGPRREVMWRAIWRCGTGSNRSAGMCEGSRPEYISYDPPTERYHTVAGSTPGFLDGPFSRARFGCRSYNARIREADSHDGRYHFTTDPENGHALRCLDFEKQEVRTLLRKGACSVAASSDGNVYTLRSDGVLLVLGPDGKTKKSLPLEKGKCSVMWGVYTALDEKHDRLYARTFRGKEGWYVWYWDLETSAFHGVLPAPAKDAPHRKKNELGSFKGTAIYGEGALAFGPDDPEKRFLYMGNCDTHYLFRLDLKKQIIEGFDAVEGRFKSTGRPRRTVHSTTYYYPPIGWLEDGSFVAGYKFYYLYKRVK